MFEVRGRVIYIICIIHSERTLATARAPVAGIAAGQREAVAPRCIAPHRGCPARRHMHVMAEVARNRRIWPCYCTPMPSWLPGAICWAGTCGPALLPWWGSPPSWHVSPPSPLGHPLLNVCHSRLDVCHPLPSKCHLFLACVTLCPACVPPPSWCVAPLSQCMSPQSWCVSPHSQCVTPSWHASHLSQHMSPISSMLAHFQHVPPFLGWITLLPVCLPAAGASWAVLGHIATHGAPLPW